MDKLILRQGDNVIVYFDNEVVETKVKGFYCYGMYVEQLGVIPFSAYKFYGAGYNNGQRFITVTKKEDYEAALEAELIRLSSNEDED
jgi:hypothetical protein